MTVNYYIKCPVCNSITRMRSPAGYVYSTPVHIHCGKCNTILTGEFISDNERIKAYFIPSNCKEVTQQKYDFYGEAAGEMLCDKIKASVNNMNFLPPKPSPIFEFISSFDQNDRANFIDYACYCYELIKTWDKSQIKYTLFLDEKYDFIKEKYSNDAKKYGYTLENEFQILRYIYFSLMFDFSGIFNQNYLLKKLCNINYNFRHLDIKKLTDFISEMEYKNRFKDIQNNLFQLIFSFIKISNYLTPAIGASLYHEPINNQNHSLGISTCTFEDIKHFYLDAFEILTECSDIVMGLDNIKSRESYDSFKNNLTMDKFRKQSKGNKVKFFDYNEFFTQEFDLPNNSIEIRNAIGHKDYSYDGIEQKIEYRILKTNEKKEIYLVDISIECVRMARSAYILLFYLYELIRYKNRKSHESIEMNKVFYLKTKSQDRCPCGSGRKYKDCCKKLIKEKLRIKNKKYPSKANIEFSISTDFNRNKKFH